MYFHLKHKERLKYLLEESRKNDPSLPSWQSLLGKGSYVDKYGFKYDKENEALLMQYLCHQLNLFYDRYPKLNEEMTWRYSISELQKTFIKTVNLLLLFFQIILPYIYFLFLERT